MTARRLRPPRFIGARLWSERSGCRTVRLRINAMQGAREGDGLAHVIEGADPCDEALDAHAEACVRDRAVAAQVEIPLEGFEGKLVVLDAALEQFIARHALRAADDFAVALRSEHVYAERKVRILRVRLHIERLHCRGIA